MASFLKVAIVVLFVILLGLNIYFKANILKAYKMLLNNNVDFSIGQLLNKNKLHQQVLPKYPAYKAQITTLASKLKFAVVFAITIILVLILLGGTLLFL